LTFKINYWYYYGQSFSSPDDYNEEKTGMKLGCLKQCQVKMEKMEVEFIKTLPEHSAFLAKVIGSKKEVIAQEFADNSKIYHVAVADIGKIPPLQPVPILPSLDYMLPGYMDMINAPTI
jgi:hypothetical protein